MYKLLVSDLSRTLLFIKQEVASSINEYFDKLSAEQPGLSFWDHFAYDDALAETYRKFSQKGGQVCLYTSGKVQEQPELAAKIAETFKDVVTPKDLNAENKTDVNGYKTLLERFGVAANEAIFVDDDLGNRQAAEAIGITTCSPDVEQVFKLLEL